MHLHHLHHMHYSSYLQADVSVIEIREFITPILQLYLQVLRHVCLILLYLFVLLLHHLTHQLQLITFLLIPKWVKVKVKGEMV